MARVAFYSGSFDPPTNGHVDVMAQSARLCDRLVVGVGSHPTKSGLFSVDERIAMIRGAAEEVVRKGGAALEVVSFGDLAVSAARRVGAGLIVRGLRDATDFDYEMEMAGMNRVMAPEIATVFLPASASVRTITATLVRQIASMGGDVSPFAPPAVCVALSKKFAKS
jgi:pantetheine-phosphate adenylyltransferase